MKKLFTLLKIQMHLGAAYYIARREGLSDLAASIKDAHDHSHYEFTEAENTLATEPQQAVIIPLPTKRS